MVGALLRRFTSIRRDELAPVLVVALFCFCVLSALLVLAPAGVGERTGQVFCVWFSVFDLFATMLFWALMTDRFTLGQSKRLFGAIAVGGTSGAIFGPWLASVLARPLGTPALLPVAAGFLVLALGAAWSCPTTWVRRPARCPARRCAGA